MPDRLALEAAVSAGIITSAQARALSDFWSSRGAEVEGGEEDLRFIRNFHDVFLATGILLLALGLAIGIAVYAAASKELGAGSSIAGVLALVSAVVMWGLGEVFARRRRLFLPAIAIVVALTGFVVVGTALLYAGISLGRGADWRVDFGAMSPQLRTVTLISLSAAVAAPLAFYARFRLPFALGLTGAAAASLAIGSAFLFRYQTAVDYFPLLTLAAGVALFIAGVVFDARDPSRTSRFSDNGFWLHFAAAPLILNGAFGFVSRAFADGAQQPSLGSIAAQSSAGAVGPAVATLLVVAVLGVISLLINRRALIVSALLTTGAAIGALLNAVGLGAGILGASTFIVLGLFVLILGAGWHAARRALLDRLQPTGVWARVFPPEQSGHHPRTNEQTS